MNNKSISKEAIAYQSGKVFFSEITNLFNQYLSHRNTKDLSKQLSGAIKHHTNITTEIKIGESYGAPDAATSVPNIRNNHPFLNGVTREYIDADDIKSQFKRLRTTRLTAAVDRKHHRVEGAFADVTQRVYLGSGLMDALEPAECAAILLHEIGHWFTFFETMADALLVNFVLTELSKDAVKDSERTLKMDLYLEAADLLQADKKRIQRALDDDTQDSAMQVILLEERIRPQESNSGITLYDLRACEQVADQFVSRLGGGKDLAVGLDKISRMYGDINYQNKYLFHTLNVLATILFSPLIIAFVVPMMLIVGTTPAHEIYDPMDKRLTRIRNDLVGTLRSRHNLPKAKKDQLVDEIETIDKLIKQVNSNMPLIERVWTWFSPSLRNEKQKLETARQLENLAANSLFVKAQKFTQLT